ncbi:TetR family transcriptional regulator [Levilactobacillus bambusae]|uniref:HTH tetR-type domain-containing protein n=1 Tax=Levilactobacillus bambusae TaxID=2024736 RepID=A0A2V1N056_9LACO|nr:TetR family transcriptional regulator [Levilactobacillus bambusae]PWF99755.1 hypothetical protein DCM90_06755 [Levilactobacillus bambusae]
MQVSDTVSKLISALLEVGETKTFDRITVKEITERADIHRKTFYYYYSDKYELLRDAYVVNALKYWDRDQLTLVNWERQTGEVLKAIKEHYRFYENSIHWDGGLWHRMTVDRIGYVINKTLNQFEPDTKGDARFSNLFISGGIMEVMNTWIGHGCQTEISILLSSFKQMIADFMDIIPRLTNTIRFE